MPTEKGWPQLASNMPLFGDTRHANLTTYSFLFEVQILPYISLSLRKTLTKIERIIESNDYDFVFLNSIFTNYN